MKQRRLGKCGVKVTEVGLGCWQLAGDWHPVSESEAVAILKSAVDEGIRFFDTADVYGNGMSEHLIGRFLKDCPEPIFVATKVGRGGAIYPDHYSLKTVTQHIEGSLQRLGVEVLDLVQLHCVPTAVLQRGDIFGWLDILQEQGKILRWGASVETVDEALLCMEQPHLVSLQIILNCLRQKPVETILKVAERLGTGIIVRLPLASGLLSGKFNAETRFGEKDPRQYNKDGECFNVGEIFGGLPFDRGLAAVEQIRPWIPEGMTMAQMALRWLLDFEAVTTVIPGATRVEHVRSNAAASSLAPLPSGLHMKLRDLYWDQVHDHIRGGY